MGASDQNEEERDEARRYRRGEESATDAAMASLTCASVIDHACLGARIRCRRRRGRCLNNHSNVLF